jgi:cytochrome c oxidase cbb3-type subunit III
MKNRSDRIFFRFRMVWPSAAPPENSMMKLLLSRSARVASLTAVLIVAPAALPLQAQHPNPDDEPKAPTQLPDAPGKDTVQKVCSTCHSANLVLGKGLTREQWGQMVASMVARGAKGSESELTQVVDYLATNLPPNSAGGTASAARPGARRPGGGGPGAGPNDKQIVDPEAADRGKKIYIAECITCHGPKARGSDNNGSDLVRSVVVLHDRYGSTLGPFLHKGHQTQSGTPSANLTQAQVEELSHFLHERVGDTLRSGPYNKVLNVLTGDPKAGEAYFNGAGKCSSCHSPTGDLAGIAKRYDPPTLQQRFLFPRTVSFGRRSPGIPSKPVMLTVTPPGSTPVTGALDHLDDFTVALRDDSGEYHAWKRTPDLKVEKKDPYAAHIELLDQYTDKNMHDVVAYLETLK